MQPSEWTADEIASSDTDWTGAGEKSTAEGVEAGTEDGAATSTAKAEGDHGG
jgi:hypothetical protein